MTQEKAIQSVRVGDLLIGPGTGLTLIAGPCVIESREHTLNLAERIRDIAGRLDIPLVFKASFDKANRSSINSFRGPGLEAGLEILQEVRATLDLPVTSDIHEVSQAATAGRVLDLLQIPAFLARQTDLIIACAETGRPVNIKKGQFMAPDDMHLVVEKARSAGATGVLLTERGTFFGYGRLVNDMTALAVMAKMAPVVFDATHSCQLPGQAGHQSGGRREMTPLLARAALAAGAHALFLEVHDDPPNAMSDSATVWPIDRLESLLVDCRRIADAVET